MFRNYGLRSPQQYQICKENSSVEAASFHFENRYTAYEECTNPCKSLKVTTNLKYKRKSDKNQKSGQVKFYFPREIQITEEIVVKSLLTLGVFNFHQLDSSIYENYYLNFSCGDWWILGNDTGCESFRS